MMARSIKFAMIGQGFFELVVCLSILMIQFQSGQSYKDGLYDTDDKDVLPLDTESFNKLVVENKDQVFWVVEFYNTWCGHCIHFAPTWKLLGHSFREWDDLVKIAAIDCSQSKNLGTCRDFNIDRYPSVKVFPAEQKNRMKQGIAIDSQELLMIRKEILTVMTNMTPSEWPRLAPLRKIEDIWDEKKASHTDISLIFELSSSLLGSEVILDMRHSSTLLVRRMEKDQVTKYGITKFPSLYKINPDSGYTLLAVGKSLLEEDRKTFVSVLRGLSKIQEGETDSGRNQKDGGNTQSLAKMKISDKSASHFNCSMISMQDLESALHYGFRQEIAICKTIDGQKFKALQNFIRVLLKYFPGRPPILGFLKKVGQLLSDSSTNSLTGEEWMDNIDRLQDDQNFLPNVIEWDCCRGSLPRYRGYPCAMWTLFHTLTVGAYLNGQGHGRSSSPVEVPLAIRGYMEHFFGCQECSKNFLAMSDGLEGSIGTHGAAVLWLWNAHNRANKRLSGDLSEDPAFPKIQFPSRKACPGCYLMNAHREIINETWNEEMVLQFLLTRHSDKNIMISKALAERSYQSGLARTEAPIPKDRSDLDWWENKQHQHDLRMVERLRAKKRNSRPSGKGEDLPRANIDLEVVADGGWGFNHLDLSMCVVFYVISTAIIFILYHHFIVRKTSCKKILSRI